MSRSVHNQPPPPAPPPPPAGKLVLIRLNSQALASLDAIMNVIGANRPDLTRDDAVCAALNTLSGFLDFQALMDLSEEGGK